MFTLRALAAVSLFLFGTAFLWMTAGFEADTSADRSRVEH